MTTNLVNGKIYIGKHETENPNDDYLGSGKHIKRAIEKYSEDSFSKDVLFVFDNEDDMNAKEAELVTEEFVKLSSNYNLCPGGKGGFGYINGNVELVEIRNRKISKNRDYKSLTFLENLQKSGVLQKRSEQFKLLNKEGNLKHDTFTGKTHTDEWKLNHSNFMKNKFKGENNPNYDKYWITNGIESVMILVNVEIPEGWKRGRVGNFTGKCWITDGINSKLISKDLEIPEGWKKGRVGNFTGK